MSPTDGSVSPKNPPSTPTPLPVALPNLLATGLGFGLNVSGDTNKASTLCKADGVAVYLKRAATLILSHVVGSKVFGDGLSTWEQHVVENVRRWNEQQALLRAQKNSSQDGRENDSDEPPSGILSPVLQSSQALKNRSKTPLPTSPVRGGPLPTSPIRRQIKTASSGEMTRRTKREGSQVGFVNSAAASLQKKVSSSPVTNLLKKSEGPSSARSLQQTQPLLSINSQESPLDSSDSDPYDLYLSGLATSLDGSDNQQQLFLQHTPIRSPTETRAEEKDTHASEDPPPCYPLEELDLRPFFLTPCCSPGGLAEEAPASEQNKEPNTSLEGGSLTSPRPLSLSSGNTPRGINCLEPLKLGSVSGKTSLLKPSQEASGWITPTDSKLVRPSKIPSPPTAESGRNLLSTSLPGRVSRATFTSRASNRVKTLDLPSAPTASSTKPKPKVRHTSREIHKPVPGVSHLLPALRTLPPNSASGGPISLSSLQGVKKLLVAKS